MRIGLLLGTFDPPHIGHVYLAVQARETGQFDQIWVCPAYNSPWKPDATAFKIRLSMCDEVFREFQNDRVPIRVSNKDRYIRSEYTYQFLKSLKKNNTNDEFTIIAGSDVNPNHWKYGEWILKNFSHLRISRFNFICSSTEIRNQIKNDKDPRPYIPTSIYALAKNIYKN